MRVLSPRRLVVAGMAAAVALAPASAVVPAAGQAPMTVGCFTAGESFNGQAYCLDGNHYPTLTTGLPSALSPADLDKDSQLVGALELDGWQVPTRCNGDGVSGKREQLVYVHVQGAPNIVRTAQPWILQRLIPGANGVFEHSTQGKRAIRWVTRTTAGGCVPTMARVTVPRSANAGGRAFQAIGAAVLDALGGPRADRSYLVLVDQDEGDCGLGQVRQDPTRGASNINNTGGAVAMVWPACWTGLTAAHELTHTLGAVQQAAPHHTTLGHCWDGHDAMCYADGSPQAQRLVCAKPDDYRKLDCNGDDYFVLFPKPGSYLSTHWNSASSAFLISSRPRALPTRPAQPTGLTVTWVDQTHVQLAWQPGVTKRGAVTSWTVLVDALGGEVLGDGNGLWPYMRSSSQVVVKGKQSKALVTVPFSSDRAFAVYGSNGSGDGVVSGIVTGGAPPITPTLPPVPVPLR
jgi:hypothetical protein